MGHLTRDNYQASSGKTWRHDGGIGGNSKTRGGRCFNCGKECTLQGINPNIEKWKYGYFILIYSMVSLINWINKFLCIVFSYDI